MAVPNIHIMPIKRFISAPDIPKGAVAIMSSSEQIDESRVKVPFIVAYYQTWIMRILEPFLWFKHRPLLNLSKPLMPM